MNFFFFFSSRRRHTRWNCDWSSDVCSSDLRVRGLRPAIASRRNLSRSRSAHHISGFGAESGTSHSISSTPGPCAEISRELRFFRRIISAELIPMRVSQVEKVDLPSKLLRCRNALRRESCTASSASSRFRVMRCTVRKSFSACARYNASSAAVSPLFAVASKLASFVHVTSCRADGAASPSVADASTALYVLAIFILQRSLFLLTFTGACFWPTSFPEHPLPDIWGTVQN